MVSIFFFMLTIFLLKFSLSYLSILITSVLNCVSGRLVDSISFCSFSEVFFLLFYLGNLSLFPHFVCLSVFISIYFIGISPTSLSLCQVT